MHCIERCLSGGQPGKGLDDTGCRPFRSRRTQHRPRATVSHGDSRRGIGMGRCSGTKVMGVSSVLDLERPQETVIEKAQLRAELADP